jgi:hypothetical protein
MDQEVVHIDGVKHGATGSSQQGYSRQRPGVNTPGEIFGLWSGRRKMRTKNGQIFVLGSASQTKDQRFFCLFTAENLWSLVKK